MFKLIQYIFIKLEFYRLLTNGMNWRIRFHYFVFSFSANFSKMKSEIKSEFRNQRGKLPHCASILKHNYCHFLHIHLQFLYKFLSKYIDHIILYLDFFF